MTENTSDLVGQQLGNYRLLRLLGQGGFADVYLGQHVYLNTNAAIKVLRMRLTNESTASFKAEAQTIARLDHPHIVRVLDFGVEQNGTPFLVMVYAPNGTLRALHPQRSQLPLPTVIAYVKQAAAALQYAHDQRLIHRDIKPENMLLDQNNNLLLSDFGIAMVSQSSRYSGAGPRDIIGTIAYMAPEQLQGRPGSACDQYALATVAYEWLSGAPPFQGTFMELYAQQLASPPPSLLSKVPQITPDIEQILFKALAKDPQQRFDRIADFAQALEQGSAQTIRSNVNITTLNRNLPPSIPIPPPPPGYVPPQSNTYSTNITPSINTPTPTAPTFITPRQTQEPAVPNQLSTPSSGQQPQASSTLSVHPTPPRRPQNLLLLTIIGVLLAVILVLILVIPNLTNKGNTSSTNTQQSHTSTTTAATQAQAAPTIVPTATPTSSTQTTATPSLTATPAQTSATPQAPSSPGQLLYTADWSTGLNDWSGSQAWKWIQPGEIGSSASDTNDNLILSSFSPPSPNYAVEAKIQYVSGNYYVGIFGVLTRADATDNGYLAGIIPADGPINSLLTGGPYVHSTNSYTTDNNFHTYRVEVKIDTVTFFIDNQRISQITDNTYLTARQVGLYEKETQVNITSFKVYSL